MLLLHFVQALNRLTKLPGWARYDVRLGWRRQINEWLSLAIANGSKRAGKAMEELIGQMTPDQFNLARAEMLSAAGHQISDQKQ